MGELKKDTQKNTVSAFKNNDQRVLANTYKSVFPRLRSYVLKNNGSEVDAKDVFQEAFIICWRNIKENKLVENSNVEAYLFTIAKNKWMDHLRSAAHKKSFSSEDLESMDIPEEESVDENELEKKTKLLKLALSRLGENCKTLLNMFYFNRKSMEEISKQLNITSSSARNQKYRCMEKLKMISIEIKQNEQFA